MPLFTNQVRRFWDGWSGITGQFMMARLAVNSSRLEKIYNGAFHRLDPVYARYPSRRASRPEANRSTDRLAAASIAPTAVGLFYRPLPDEAAPGSSI